MEQNLVFHIITHALSLATDGPAPAASTGGDQGSLVDWTDLAVSMLALGAVIFGVIVGTLCSRRRPSDRYHLDDSRERERLLPAN
jgi:hypothetical protein